MSSAVGLVVPAYRPDVDRLAAYVRSLRENLDLVTIRIELDAPVDGVPAGLADLPAEIHTVPYRRGKGAAITAGFEALSTDVLAFADADGATPADSLAEILAPVRDGTVDLAVGSRRHPEATVDAHQTLARRYLGDGFVWLAHRLLEVDLYDYQCGAKAIDAAAWEAVRQHLYEPGFAWDVELIAIAGAVDLSVAEIPIEWHDRPGSTVSPVRDSLRLARALVTARHRAKRLRDSRLHTALAARRDEESALVEQK
ncbi:glycosyltransferase [Salinibaculum rarum]|uniref:glycosyltransferase n=1 Tax=Salinibaculum rarum TaxID=3058903 RepID=UPI00265D688D|nr:glycosyltransferase [Salinibaculum sp. KK48]